MAVAASAFGTGSASFTSSSSSASLFALGSSLCSSACTSLLLGEEASAAVDSIVGGALEISLVKVVLQSEINSLGGNEHASKNGDIFEHF